MVSEMVENSYMQIIVFKCELARIFYYGIPKTSDSDWKGPIYNEEAQVRSLGQEDPPEKGKITHSSILAWRILWTEEPGGLRSNGPQRVGHN